MFSFDSGDGKQACTRLSERSGRSTEMYSGPKIFNDLQINSGILKINYLTHRKPVQTTENRTDVVSISKKW